MASIGHVAVGMVTGRLHARGSARSVAASMAVFAALSVAPDLDAISFVLRIPYAAPWGHRGASHSLAMALLAGLLASVVAHVCAWPRLKTAVLVALTVASHGLLDALTNGGLGVALLWPWSDARFFAPVHPIPVAPIGRDFFTARGWAVAAQELVLFSPLFAWALLAGWLRRVAGRGPR